jgi:hypothetical protein
MSKLEKDQVHFEYLDLSPELIAYLFKKPYVINIITGHLRSTVYVTFKHIELTAEEKYAYHYSLRNEDNEKKKRLYLQSYKQMQNRIDRIVVSWHPNFFIRNFRLLALTLTKGRYNPFPLFKRWHRQIKEQQYRAKLQQATTGLFNPLVTECNPETSEFKAKSTRLLETLKRNVNGQPDRT